MEIFPYSKYKNGIMSEVHERLEEIVSSFDGGKTDFAKALGIDFKTQRNYLNGKTKPSFDFLVGLHQMGHDVMYVLTGERQVPEGFVNVPRLAATASMGTGIDSTLPHDEIIDHVSIAKNWLRDNLETFTGFQNLALVTGRGSSMQGTFSHGDVLFADIGVKELDGDGVYQVEVNGEIYIKRLQRLPNGNLKMISDNKKYDNYELTKRDQVRIIARIVGVWSLRKIS